MATPAKASKRFAIGRARGLLLASTALLFAKNLPLASAVCEDLGAACENDAACLSCLTYTQTAEDITTTACAERYPGIWSTGGEGYTTAFCQSTGGSYCCDFEDNDAAETCMENTVAASYWSCLMDDAGCAVEEMPCYSSADVLQVVTTPAPVRARPAAEPTAFSYSFSSSGSTNAPNSASSSSTSALNGCDAEIAECDNDATCLECTASTSTTHNGYTAECEALYPDNFNYASEGGTWRFCDSQGAYFCCEFETEVFATTCMENAVTASYWDCLLVNEGCSVDDMPCYGGATPAPGVVGTKAPISSSSGGSNDRDLDITQPPTPVAAVDSSAAGSDASASPVVADGASASPVVADGATSSPTDDTPATLDVGADANGAARVGAPSTVLALGCAAWLLAAVV